MRLNWVCRMGKIMLLLILSLGACSEEKEGELCFVGDSLVAGWDVKDAFPTWIVRNDGVSGAKLEDIVTWNLNYQDKNVVMLIGTNNLGGKLFNDATRQEFITDFVDEYKRTIEGLAPRRVFVISILPRNREIDNPHIDDYIKELNFRHTTNFMTRFKVNRINTFLFHPIIKSCLLYTSPSPRD